MVAFWAIVYTALLELKNSIHTLEFPQDLQAVAQLADKKVDIVKIWVDDHLGREPKISMDLCRAIAFNANKHGLKVAAHVHYLEDARRLVEVGVSGPAHSIRDAPVDDALIASMKRRGAWQAAATLTRELSTFVYAKPQPFPGAGRW